MVDKIKFVIKVTAKIPAWRQGNVPFPSARFWHDVVLLRHAIQYSILSCLHWTVFTSHTHWRLTGMGTAVTPLHDMVSPAHTAMHTLGPASVTSDIREREREREK